MRRDHSVPPAPNVVSFRRDLNARRSVVVQLPEFLLVAMEERVREANEGADEDERISFDDFLEAELVKIVTLHDVAVLDARLPGYAAAVDRWLSSLVD